MSLPHRPRFTYNDGSAATLNLSLPQEPWRYLSAGVGGSLTMADGTPVRYQIRRNHRYALTLRFLESEWAAVLRMLEHGQRGGLITVRLDQSEAAEVALYLETPELEEDIAPERDEYFGALRITITVRSATGAALTAPYFDA